HLFEDRLVLLGARLDDAALGEAKADPLDEVPVAVERLVEADPPLGPAPVGAREELEAGDVPASPAEPTAALAELHPQVDVLALHVQALDLQRVEALPRLVELPADLLPARDRVLLVEEARVDDLLPVVLDADPGLGGHRLGPVEAERPAEAARVLLLPAPVHNRPQRLAAAHDLRRVDLLEGVGVGVGDDRDLMVHLVDHPAQVARGEVRALRVACELEEVPRAAAALFLVRVVAADHVAAGAPDRPAQL